MAKPHLKTLDFGSAPVLWECLNDNNPVRLVVGPVGSSKTTAFCAEVMRRAMQQEPSPHDNIRRFKAAIVRNTLPELKRTTIPTWLSVFPEDMAGPMRQSSPVRHHIRIAPKADCPGLDLLVEFIALDQPRDVRELLSYEGTLIWFNEVREIPKALVDAATLRVGRYPSKAQGNVDPTWFGVVGDTNAPAEDHWIYRADMGINEFGEHIGRPAGWSIYFQPTAVVEVERRGDKYVSVEDEPVKIEVFEENHVHAAAGSYWAVNPNAENLMNLPVNKHLDPDGDPMGPGGYYAQGMSGKERDWIRVYFQARYGFVREGKPVIPQFDPQTMVVDDLPEFDGGILAGADIGGNTLNPACIFFQRGPRGLWLVHDEVVVEGFGLDRFTDEMSIRYAKTFGNRPFEQGWGDPAGVTRDGIYETMAFEHLRAKGWNFQPAPSQDINIRIDAIKQPMGRYIDGKPGILIHRRCSTLIQALSGQWKYRRMNVTGVEKYAETPDKSHPFSDAGDGLGYGLSGAGETNETRTPQARKRGFGTGQQHTAQVSFDVFD